jgi:hypothetical protein
VQDKAIPIPSVSQVVGDYVAVPSGRKILKLGLSQEEIRGVLNLDPGKYYTLAIYPLSQRLQRSLKRSDSARSYSTGQEWSSERVGVVFFSDEMECAPSFRVHLRFLNLSSIDYVDVYLSDQLLFESIPVGKVYRGGEAVARSTIHPIRVEITQRLPSSIILQEVEIELREHHNYTLVFFGSEMAPEAIVLKNGDGLCRNAF